MEEAISKRNEKNKGRILIVDDEEAFLYFAKEILSEKGYNCCCAENSREAKLYIEKQIFDLTISDIRMPGESGLDLCKYIKSRHPDVPIVLVTAIDSLETAQEAIDFDLYGYIIKPVTVNQLTISVANAMRRKQLETRQRETRKELEKMVRAKTAHLEELNTTLKVLLDQRESEKKRLEESFSERINSTILPHLDRIRRTGLSALQKEYIDFLESYLREAIKPYCHQISLKMFNLSPSEVLVVNHIKQGHSNKEIASMLNLSIRTVEFHRDNIRKKLGIKNRNINLHTYLSRSSI